MSAQDEGLSATIRVCIRNAYQAGRVGAPMAEQLEYADTVISAAVEWRVEQARNAWKLPPPPAGAP